MAGERSWSRELLDDAAVSAVVLYGEQFTGRASVEYRGTLGRSSKTAFMPLFVKKVPQDLQSTIHTLCSGGGGGTMDAALCGGCGSQPGAKGGCEDHWDGMTGYMRQAKSSPRCMGGATGYTWSCCAMGVAPRW